MRLNRYIDEVFAVYRFYRKSLTENMLQALILYSAVIMGFVIHLGLTYFIGHTVAVYLTLLIYQFFTLKYGYTYFRDKFLDEHSPR